MTPSPDSKAEPEWTYNPRFNQILHNGRIASVEELLNNLNLAALNAPDADKARLQEAATALLPFAFHKNDCQSLYSEMGSGDTTCTCGYEAARAALSQANKIGAGTKICDRCKKLPAKCQCGPTPAPAATPCDAGYRMLKVGEEIQWLDEIYIANCNK